jgi:hypothetical protein
MKENGLGEATEQLVQIAFDNGSSGWNLLSNG